MAAVENNVESRGVGGIGVHRAQTESSARGAEISEGDGVAIALLLSGAVLVEDGDRAVALGDADLVGSGAGVKGSQILLVDRSGQVAGQVGDVDHDLEAGGKLTGRVVEAEGRGGSSADERDSSSGEEHFERFFVMFQVDNVTNGFWCK